MDVVTKAVDEQTSQMNGVTNDPVKRIEKAPNALSELLAFDVKRTQTLPTDTVDMSPLFSTPWTVKALDEELNDRLVEEATIERENKRTGQKIKDFNAQRFARLVIYHCTVDPNLKDAKLREKFGLSATQHEALVRRVLRLPGYADRVSNKIMDLSGYADQLVNVAKNSFEGED